MSVPNPGETNPENHPHRPTPPQDPQQAQVPSAEVPNVLGMTVASANHVINTRALKAVYAYNTASLTPVQDPASGQTLTPATPGVDTEQGRVPVSLVDQSVAALDVNTTVVSQDPVAGTRINPGSEVRLLWQETEPEKKSPKWPIFAIAGAVLAAAAIAVAFLFGGSDATKKATALMTVPSVTKMTVTEATPVIENANLVVGQITKVPSKAPAGTIVAQNPTASSQVAKGTAVNLDVSTGTATVTVPNLVGSTAAAAKGTLKNAGLVEGTVTVQDNPKPAGTIISQTPVAGSSVSTGTKVNIITSNGKVKVPSVLGMSEEAASQALDKAGFVVKTVTAVSSSAKPGTVTSQNPAPGKYLAAEETVTITIAVAAPSPTPTVSPKPSVTPTPTPTP